MKKVVVAVFIMTFLFFSSCGIIGPRDDSLPRSYILLTGDTGDNLLVVLSSFPPKDRIKEDEPINFFIEVINRGKEEVSGVIEISDGVADSGEYGGIDGVKVVSFFVEGVNKDEGEREKKKKYNDVAELSGIQYRKVAELRNAVIRMDLKISKKKELISKEFCVKRLIDQNVAGCDAHPRVSFEEAGGVVSLSDLEFFASGGNTVDKISFEMDLNENPKCTIISSDIEKFPGDELLDESTEVVRVDASLVLLSNVGFDCKISSKSDNQKIIKCNNVNDLVVNNEYYKGEKIKVDLNYGCSYRFDGNIRLLEKEAS